MNVKELYYSIMIRINDYLEQVKKNNATTKNTILVELLGVTRGFISELLKGNKKLSTSKCLLLAEELKIKPEIILITMLYEKEESTEIKEKLKEIIYKLDTPKK